MKTNEGRKETEKEGEREERSGYVGRRRKKNMTKEGR